VEREYYIRSDTRGELYFTLFNLPVTESWSFKAVLAFHSALSFILPHPFAESGESNPQIEKVNLLFIDGMFTGRGWDPRTVRQGTRGKALWENWMELRFPLVPGILAFDFFFDAAWGMGNSTPEKFFTQGFSGLLENMYFSFGFGPRITFPQFPFRFLFAARFQVKDGQVVWEETGNMLGPLRFVLSLSIPVQ
jgi:outer membrane protein insertion porin family